jgi:hypothetical protein
LRRRVEVVQVLLEEGDLSGEGDEGDELRVAGASGGWKRRTLSVREDDIRE